MNNLKNELELLIRLEIKTNEKMSEHTSFGIGGPALYLVRVQSMDMLSAALAAAKRYNLPSLVLGDGTNLLVSDKGFSGLVIDTDINHMNISKSEQTIVVGASVKSSFLVESAIEAGLGGLEFAAGLPGSIGGAIAGNAGCFWHTLSEFIKSVKISSKNGDIFTVSDPSWFKFEYRNSRIKKEGYAIGEVTFRLEKKNKSMMRRKVQKNLKIRVEKHPPAGTLTAGSYFKNIPPEREGDRYLPAGKFLDLAGAKKLKCGDAAVFERHANIVINKGRASAEDVLELTRKMASAVKDKFLIELEPEVLFKK